MASRIGMQRTCLLSCSLIHWLHQTASHISHANAHDNIKWHTQNHAQTPYQWCNVCCYTEVCKKRSKQEYLWSYSCPESHPICLILLSHRKCLTVKWKDYYQSHVHAWHRQPTTQPQECKQLPSPTVKVNTSSHIVWLARPSHKHQVVVEGKFV